MIPIVISVLGTIPKGLIRELEVLEIGGRAETIQSRAFSRSVRILEKILET